MKNKNFKKNYKTLNFLRLEKYIKENPEKTLKEIGAHFGVSRATVSLRIQEHALKYNSKRPGMKNLNIHNEIETCIKNNPDASMHEIASFLGVTTTIIRNKIKKHNINYTNKKTNNKLKFEKRIYKINYEELKQFLEKSEFLTYTEIAEKFSVSDSYLRWIMKKYNIEYIKTKYEKINIEELKEYIKDNTQKNLKGLSEAFGVSLSYLSNLIKKYNIKHKKYNYEYIKTKYEKINIDIEELKEYIKNNPDASLEKIGKHFSVKKQVIFYYIKKYNIDYKRSKKTLNINFKKLEEYIKNNPRLKLKDLGKAFNTSSSYISALMKKHNIEYKKIKTDIKKKEK